MAHFALASRDPDIIQDLRALNGRPKSDLFDAFWAELAKLVQEHSRVDDRRHGLISYLPVAHSIPDLRRQVVVRLEALVAAGTLNAEKAVAPSVKWISYQFCPKHPSHAANLAYTGEPLPPPQPSFFLSLQLCIRVALIEIRVH